MKDQLLTDKGRDNEGRGRFVGNVGDGEEGMKGGEGGGGLYREEGGKGWVGLNGSKLVNRGQGGRQGGNVNYLGCNPY